MSPATATICITEERTFSAKLGERTVTGLAIASAWEGFTKYTNGHGDHLIVLDAEKRVITASPDLIAHLAIGVPVVGQPYAGGIYAGLTEVDGKPAYLVLMPGDAADVSWQEATEWAQFTGSLPTRAEQRTLYQALKSEFEPAWYWSSEQYAAYPDYAWTQIFDNGYQGDGHKSYAGRARAVRRLPIQ